MFVCLIFLFSGHYLTRFAPYFFEPFRTILKDDELRFFVVKDLTQKFVCNHLYSLLR